MSPIAPGEVFLGKYRIEKVLGTGGMGVVVAARHLQLDELVAIKFLHATFAAQKDQVERFLREGRAAVKIKSEHVARVRDVDVMENGAPFMIMEHLTGLDLGDLIERDGALPIPEAVEYLLQTCECLAEAHTSGIVHRDLKPANLFLMERADGSPCIKVLDFGISKLRDAQQAALTNTNGMMGSPLYMAPEQLSSAKTVDNRADIWALGVILYELVSGRRPFQADSLPQLVFTVATEPPIPLTESLASAPKGLEELVARCLQKKPDDRFADVGAFAKALEPYAPEECIASIERIVRVVQGTTNPGARKRTGRTFNPASRPADSSTPHPVLDVATAATIASGRGLNTTNSGTVASERPAEKAAAKKEEPTQAPQKKSAFPIFAAVAGVAVIGAIAFFAMRTSTPATPASQPQAPEKSAPVAPSVAPTAPTAPIPAPTPSPDTKVVEPAPVPASASAKPIGKAIAVPTAKASAKPSATAAKPSCDPPYTIDSEGNKHYKMECL